jgi:membrane-associated HD superfamily phosphohydrolase
MKFIIFPFGKYINLDNIFEKIPAIDFELIYLVAFFSLLMFIGFLFWLYYRKKKREIAIWSKFQTGYFNLFFYAGIAGLIIAFFRWQQIAYLGSRFFDIVLILIFAAWLINILIFRYFIFSKELKTYYDKKNFEKYLPNNKEKK